LREESGAAPPNKKPTPEGGASPGAEAVGIDDHRGEKKRAHRVPIIVTFSPVAPAVPTCVISIMISPSSGRAEVEITAGVAAPTVVFDPLLKVGLVEKIVPVPVSLTSKVSRLPAPWEAVRLPRTLWTVMA